MRLVPFPISTLSNLIRLALLLTVIAPLGAQTTSAPGPFVSDSGGGPGGGGDSGSGADSGMVATDPQHVLQPQDIVRVEIFQEDDLNKQCDGLSVSQNSTLTLPLIGTVSVKDKTVQQVQSEITALYNQDYLVNPQITVSVVKYASRSVNVIGSVTKQGRVDFPPARGLSIIDAISLAGGQTRLADLKHVKLTRINANGESVVRQIDVDAMMKRAGSEPVMLKPGDIIYVPERML